ncbi:DUF1059 domain-containing protein [Terracoccus luteus]|jgi:hypothetical protein|uniref:Uncharacterized protein n=1 Tax=Terracoccus luteus TaxID=53356 RepID=A0A839Q187_9MICO|nr:DUF1059 domain-containing protein [Terracoccus luteus]MBB2988055.1 hypothetical protein [Terracoccus luteus]MCP2173706.1 hypothetical protein [Terracoccus luteus]
MKTMTCRDLGGPCDTAHHGESADDVIQAQDAHLKAAQDSGDESHREAADAMAARWKDPAGGMGWYQDTQQRFADLPED